MPIRVQVKELRVLDFTSIRFSVPWGPSKRIRTSDIGDKGRSNRNRKLLISRAPTKAKSQEPAYSQALNQNKFDRQRSRSRESGRQTVRRLWWMVFGVES